MAIIWIKATKLTGLSSDTKPTNVPTNVTFYETDTKVTFLFDGSDWIEISLGEEIEYSLVRSDEYARSNILRPFVTPTKIANPDTLPIEVGELLSPQMVSSWQYHI